MPDPLAGIDQSNAPYIIVSSDTHAGLFVGDYRDYLEASLHAEFDEWPLTRHQHRAMVQELNGEYVEQWERDNEFGLKGAYDPEIRDKTLDADGVAGEIIFADRIARARCSVWSPPAVLSLNPIATLLAVTPCAAFSSATERMNPMPPPLPAE